MSEQAQPRGVADEQVLGKAYDARLIKRLWPFVKPHWRLFVTAMVLMPITVAFEVAQPYLLKVAFDDYIAASTPTVAGLHWVALGYIALVLLQALANFGQHYCLQLLGQRSMHDLRQATYNHVIGQRSAFFDRMPVGRLLTRMTNDVESINEMFATGVVTLLADIVKLLAIVAMMLVLDVQLTLMTFLVLPVLIVLVRWARGVMRTSFREIRVKLAAMNAYVAEHLSGIKVVQLFRREARAHAAYDEINASYRDAYLGAIRADATMYAVVEAVGVVSIACAAWWAASQLGVTATEDTLTIGLVIAFIEYINKFFIPIKDLSAKYTVMQGAMAAAERIVGLHDMIEPDAPLAPDRADAASSDDDDAASASASSDQSRAAVAFEEVVFSYRDGEPVLRGVSLQVPRGKTVAVVGATGSGKSTLIKLLTRLYEPDSGAIRVAGRDVRGLRARELRERITVVSQDVFLFAGTVGENVALGLPESQLADHLDADARVSSALRRVGADRLLERRGAGPEAEVAERGANFSAGERQLIAFARALIRDPEILVLDEATAHVDPTTEELIERGLEELMRDRTTLVIAHRLTTIRNADEIIVMARGEIVERGTHDQLIALDGTYSALERTFSRHD